MWELISRYTHSSPIQPIGALFGRRLSAQNNFNYCARGRYYTHTIFRIGITGRAHTQFMWTLTFVVSFVGHICTSSMWRIRAGASIPCSRRISPQECSRIAPWIVWWLDPWSSFSHYQSSDCSLTLTASYSPIKENAIIPYYRDKMRQN